MYKVIEAFMDLHDQNYPYGVGDTFPRVGVAVTDKRLKELSGSSNKQGRPLIKETEDEKITAAIRKATQKK